jgi:hypothetical protein
MRVLGAGQEAARSTGSKHSGSLSFRKQTEALPGLTHPHPTLSHCLRYLMSFSRELDVCSKETLTSPWPWPAQSRSPLSKSSEWLPPGVPFCSLPDLHEAAPLWLTMLHKAIYLLTDTPRPPVGWLALTAYIPVWHHYGLQWSLTPGLTQTLQVTCYQLPRIYICMHHSPQNSFPILLGKYPWNIYIAEHNVKVIKTFFYDIISLPFNIFITI